jgi:hypothetical protein
MEQMDRSSNAHISELNQRIRSLERQLDDASKEARCDVFGVCMMVRPHVEHRAFTE